MWFKLIYIYIYDILKHANHVYTKHQNPKIYDANTHGFEGKNGKFHNNWGLQYSDLNNDRTGQQENRKLK